MTLPNNYNVATCSVARRASRRVAQCVAVAATSLTACTALANPWPLDIGNTWSFQEGTVMQVVGTQLPFAGPQSRSIRRSKAGRADIVEVYSSGTDTLNLDGTSTSAFGSSAGSSIDFDPPIKVIDGANGELVTTGTAKFYSNPSATGSPIFEPDYDATVTVVDNARLITPAGTFTTQRVVLIIRLQGTQGGDPNDPVVPAVLVRRALWLVPDLGIVRESNLRTNPDTVITMSTFDVATTFADNDGDGFIDIADNCAANPNADQLDTDQDFSGNACDNDDDNDDLTDVSEVTTYQTDPLNPDTDNDGRPDGVEVARNTDPLFNEGIIIPVIQATVLED